VSEEGFLLQKNRIDETSMQGKSAPLGFNFHIHEAEVNGLDYFQNSVLHVNEPSCSTSVSNLSHKIIFLSVSLVQFGH
jgi:hypothetical protein